MTTNSASRNGQILMSEMFLEIFKHVSDVSTKLAIGRVNKAFRLLVRDSLLADLNWTYHARHASVCISLVEVEPPQIPSPLHDKVLQKNKVDWLRALRFAATFPNLQELIVRETGSTAVDVLSLLPLFPQLKDLTLSQCQLQFVQNITFDAIRDNCSIPALTTLGNQPTSFVHWLELIPALTCLRNLLELEMFISANAPPIPTIQEFISNCHALHTLRLLGRKGVDLQMGPVSLSSMFSLPFFFWINKLFIPSQELRVYDGPISLISSFLPPNHVSSLSIPEDGYQKEPEPGRAATLHPLDEIFNVFRVTPVVHSIRTLTLSMKTYERGFLQAVLPMVPQLRVLIVTYRGGGPDENDLVSLGGGLLQEHVPDIEVVKILSVTQDNSILADMARRYANERPFAEVINNIERPPPVAEPEYRPDQPLAADDVKDIILGWTWRNMLPSLKEVQLRRDSIWFRHGCGQTWFNN
ncbi:hypothetical protein DL96DRAFT_1582736 [Flagelloscypha sp. PMI_526]|nr:hypothetical protein DL96DRAFT_1582736 [Flagelloscypha sp. PMI_526]